MSIRHFRANHFRSKHLAALTGPGGVEAVEKKLFVPPYSTPVYGGGPGGPVIDIEYPRVIVQSVPVSGTLKESQTFTFRPRETPSFTFEHRGTPLLKVAGDASIASASSAGPFTSSNLLAIGAVLAVGILIGHSMATPTRSSPRHRGPRR